MQNIFKWQISHIRMNTNIVNNISLQYNIFEQINASLVSIKYLFKKHLTTDPKLLYVYIMIM